MPSAPATSSTSADSHPGRVSSPARSTCDEYGAIASTDPPANARRAGAERRARSFGWDDYGGGNTRNREEMPEALAATEVGKELSEHAKHAGEHGETHRHERLV